MDAVQITEVLLAIFFALAAVGIYWLVLFFIGHAIGSGWRAGARRKRRE